MSKINDFKKDLRDLLTKYDASIDFDCDDCSDTYGITGDHLGVCFDGQNVIKLNSGWSIDASDLNE